MNSVMARSQGAPETDRLVNHDLTRAAEVANGSYRGVFGAYLDIADALKWAAVELVYCELIMPREPHMRIMHSAGLLLTAVKGYVGVQAEGCHKPNSIPEPGSYTASVEAKSGDIFTVTLVRQPNDQGKVIGVPETLIDVSGDAHPRFWERRDNGALQEVTYGTDGICSRLELARNTLADAMSVEPTQNLDTGTH